MDELFGHAASIAARFRAQVSERPVARVVDHAALCTAFDTGLPAQGRSPREVLDALVAAADPGIVATAGPRYFGFVNGGALPAATAADIVAAGWDQNAFNALMSPAAAAAEEVAGRWLKELLRIPATASVGFVTGGQAANTVGLAAAREHVLAEAGWDVARDGLWGAPRVRVVASVERHATIDRALRVLGLGTSAIHAVAADANGAMDLDDLARVLAHDDGAPTIVSLQSGNVNTGACDDLRRAIGLAHGQSAWAHVDGAFGLWAAASPTHRHLVDGIELADSWGTDGHKWLNVPYDSGYAFCAHPAVHARAVSYTAAYLAGPGGDQTPRLGDLTLESSRRARGFATWAALQELGTDGVSALVDRCCALARRFADGLRAIGADVPNDVVLNQVLAGFGDDDETAAVIDAVQRDGTCWMGGTVWRGRRFMRVSVSNHATTEADVDRSLAAIERVWHSR